MDFMRSYSKETPNCDTNAIKDFLINILNENIKEIQYEHLNSDQNLPLVCDSVNSLCINIESIFLHGLKDSFLWHTLNNISNSTNRRPEPSFWSPILVFMHKHIIEHIHSLSQITTEIGYCRAWIRLSLNEGLLSSYLNNIRKNLSALNPYYKKYAFLRDSERIEIVSKMLEGIESAVYFSLPSNSSLLNQWTDMSLQNSGLWMPTLKHYPIGQGIDVANSISNSLDIPKPKPLLTNELFSESISNSPFDLNSDENFQVFLHRVDMLHDIEGENKTLVATEPQNENNKGVECEKTEIAIGNSIKFKNGWFTPIAETNIQDEQNLQSSTMINTINEQIPDLNRSNSMTTSISSLRSPLDHHSYNTLLGKYQKSRKFDWNDIWEKFESSLGITHESEIITGTDNIETNENSLENLNNSIISNDLNTKFSIQELHQLVENLCHLPQEQGLDNQGFVCKACSHPIGIGFSEAQFCSLTGNYYCNSCVILDQHMIPSRIIYNWDFKRYTVSKRAALFLEEFSKHPFIDLKLLNPNIYMACEEMATMQSLRIRLNFIRAYLFTCCEPIIKELQKLLFSKEYLYEHIHQYSIVDLAMIQKGTLASLLQNTVTFGEQHILKCKLCSVKGFICEICKSSKVLYPFHVNTTFRCEICGAVFHQNCLNELQPCPKCERKKNREDLPLFEAVHML